ncbi:MAG: hypothetical protein Q4P34_08320 [Tissierellia bacterium]|nr:hypothetical protein [Tissierellia bacterium]
MEIIEYPYIFMDEKVSYWYFQVINGEYLKLAVDFTDEDEDRKFKMLDVHIKYYKYWNNTSCIRVGKMFFSLIKRRIPNDIDSSGKILYWFIEYLKLSMEYEKDSLVRLYNAFVALENFRNEKIINIIDDADKITLKRFYQDVDNIISSRNESDKDSLNKLYLKESDKVQIESLFDKIYSITFLR